jgi:DNA-binding SARP family transcriptional activator
VRPSSGLEFRVLGPVEVRDGDRTIPVGGGQQRALLALLLLRANRAVSRDAIVEAVWGDEPPSTVAKALQGHVSALRRLLEPGRERGGGGRVIVTRGSGYELRVDEERLDLLVFERLRSEGRRALDAGEHERAAALLRDALALWRGPPLADVDTELFERGEVARLEEVRFATLEDRLEADVAAGKHAEVVAELEALVAEQPLRERLRAQLMVALYRSGRQADALETYRRGRALLVEELGLEPSRMLQQLERSILAQEPELDAPLRAARTAPPAASAGFVGRGPELAALTDALEQARSGHGRLVLVRGEPGIGKSRLAAELAAHARADGAVVLAGRCWEAGGAPAYWPWVQSLRAYVRGRRADELARAAGDGAADLAGLLPELRELVPNVGEPPADDGEGARFRLFEAVTSFLRRAAETTPLVLLLDDVHAADAPSLLLLQFVARELGGARLLVVATFRDVDPTLRDPLESTLVALAREPSTQTLVLTGLAEADVGRLLELTASRVPSASVVAAVHDETEGNPLFVTELGRLFAAEGRFDRVPETVRQVIGHRLRGLSPPCGEALAVAAVFGREFALAALRQTLGLADDELLELLDEPLAERLLTDVPGSHGRLRFSHALVRDVIYDGLPASRRVRLHRRAGEALEELYADDRDSHLSELAYHFQLAGPGEAAKALDYARHAAARASRLLAHEEAARLYEVALEIERGGAATVDERVRCELLLALGDAQARAGSTQAATHTFVQAADAARAAGLPELVARAALGYGGRFLWLRAAIDPQLLPLYRDALSRLPAGDSVLRAQLLSRLSTALRGEVGYVEQRVVARQAVEMARRLGDDATLAYVLDALCGGTGGPDLVQQTLADALEVISLARALGDKEREFGGHEHAQWVYWFLGDRDAIAAEQAAMHELAEELRQPAQRWMVSIFAAVGELAAGRLDAAERAIDDARTLGLQAIHWVADLVWAKQHIALRNLQGRHEDVEALTREMMARHPNYPQLRCTYIAILVQLGRAKEARALLDELAADGYAAVHFDEEWLVAMTLLAEAAVALEEQDRISELYERLAQYDHLVAVSPPEVAIGTVAHTLGLLAAELGRRSAAEAHFERALAVAERMEAPLWTAQTQAALDHLRA